MNAPMRRAVLGLSAASLLACAAGPGPGPGNGQAPAQSGREAPAKAPPESAGGGATAEDGPVADGMYRVILTRPDRVGARAKLRRVTTDVRETRTLLDGRAQERDASQRRVQLEAVSEVLAVDSDARATKTRYLVERLEADTQKGKLALVAPGTEITVVRSQGKPGELRIGSKPLGKDELEAVKAVLPTSMSETTEHDVFGSHQPRAIGDSWTVDDQKARASLIEVGITPRGPAKASARLLDKQRVGGDECLGVLGQIEAERFDLPGLPKGAETRRSKLRVRFSGAYPVDLDRPVRKHSVSISMQAEAVVSKAGKKLVILIDSQRNVDSEVDPL